MSYEGYVEELCANGHLRTRDVYQESLACPCHAPIVFEHHVNETNGTMLDDPGTLPYPFEVEKKAEFVTCDLGHKHYTSERTYKIPVGVRND